MEEIKVGDYVRINGIIGKVEQIGNVLFWLEDGSSYSLSDKKVKHSTNIIDLIEVGDYVNGKYVEEINQYKDGKFIIALIGIIDEQEIKTILTKEQFEQNSYKV